METGHTMKETGHAMKWELNGQTVNVEQALAGGAAQPAGWFRFYFTDQRWEWSEQVQRMHGYEAGSVTPTTELVLSHKHPDDRGHVAATIDQIVQTRQAFSTRHRIVDTRGNVHHVVVVGDQIFDDDGDVIGTHGFYIDVSGPRERSREDEMNAKLAEISENRAGIEQAKGMLMLIYGFGEQRGLRLAQMAVPGGEYQAAAAGRADRRRLPTCRPAAEQTVGIRPPDADRAPTRPCRRPSPLIFCSAMPFVVSGRSAGRPSAPGYRPLVDW